MFKNVTITIALIVPVVFFYGWRAWYTSSPPEFLPIPARFPEFKVSRFVDYPIVSVDLDKELKQESNEKGYTNINAPGLIRVPEWVENPLGNYYLYFSQYKGEVIRMAYADKLTGPWKLHKPPVLDLPSSYFVKESPDLSSFDITKSLFGRVSSTEFWTLYRTGNKEKEASELKESKGKRTLDRLMPYISNSDIFVDEKTQEIRIYFHGLVEDGTQLSRVAVSEDGLTFTTLPKLIAGPNFKVFKLRGLFYGIAKPGLIYRSPNGIQGFEVRPKPLAGAEMRQISYWLKGEILYLFWTRIGDSPERILCSKVNLFSNDWSHWRMTEPVEILKPEKDWEGANLPKEASTIGETLKPVNQLRNPFIFHDEEASFLLYTAAGEQSIGIVEIQMED